MKLTYTKKGDYYYPNLTDSETKDLNKLGKYGKARLRYLRQNNKLEYIFLWMNGELKKHLIDIDKKANEREIQLINEMERWQYIIKNSEDKEQKQWIKVLNNNKNAIEKRVKKELIFI